MIGADKVLFDIQQLDLPGVGTSANVVFDNTSSACLVTHKYAEMAGFQGSPVQYVLQATGHPLLPKTTLLYTFKLADKYGTHHEITALGIDLITDTVDEVNLTPIKHLFPQAPEDVWQRPMGIIDILIGSNYRSLQPSGGLERDGCAVGNLRLSESIFGCGWVLSGTHPNIQRREHSITKNARAMMNSKVVGNNEVTEKTNVKTEEDCNVSVHFSVLSTMPEFFETEDLGVQPPKLCNTCKKCPDCKFRNSSLSRDEAEVVAKQESLMSHNTTEKKIEVQYAWNENLHLLRANKTQAIGFQKSVERKLIKQDELDSYNAEIKKNIENGYLVKLGAEDLENYKGPISYVSHHPVYKASKTTPIRPVTNTSLKNNTCGISPNDCMGKPPNALSNLLNVFHIHCGPEHGSYKSISVCNNWSGREKCPQASMEMG